MKTNLRFKRIIVTAISALILSFYSSAEMPPGWLDDRKFGEMNYFRFNNSVYDWNMIPPEGCDTVNALCFFNYWESGGNYCLPKYKQLDILINKTTHELYIPFPIVKYSKPRDVYFDNHRAQYEDTWISGIFGGIKFVFKNNSTVGTNSYDLTYDYYRHDDPFEDNFSMSDTIRIYGTKIKKITQGMGYLVENYETKETRAEYFSRYYVDYTDRDVACEFSLSPLLIKNMNSTMYIGPYDSAEVINDDFYIPKNEALIKDLIIGIISPAVPTHLPTPAAEVSLEWKAGEYCIVCHDYHSGYMRIWSNATMDIVNEDGYLIDPDKVRAKFYVNGKYLYSQRVYPNDDQELVHMLVDTSFIKKDEWVKRPKVEVECVYTKDDGTTVVSPRVEAKIVSYKGPSGVTEIGDDVSFEDNTTYDLTGRPVNPENLAPGIYIRNGRKFAVGR